MDINQIYHGFRLTEEQWVPEANSTGRLFVHEKTGARLLQLANDDDNKVFGIGFRTPSSNSTGVAHILEHSVLNGSRKYRSKEPFMDMAKSSLNTFINAMTFSDKTIYPVASRNDKDFRNLMDVYLDAVFHPAIYDTKEIFLQEGWHHHIEQVDEPITYRGVVYNEMRGALSGADDQVNDAVMAALYPDTIYGKESGGDPYEIPSLTYEAFLEFHRTLYHPSNSYIFLYGNGDIEAQLAHIEEGYLHAYEALEVDSTLDLQAPFAAPITREAVYSVASDEETANKDYLVYGVMLGTRKDPLDPFVADLLGDVLIDALSAPLREALLEAGIGVDVSSLSNDGVQIPLCFVAKDTDASRQAEFVQIIEDTLRKLVQNGIDRDQILASLNKMEYQLREASGYATKGIIYYINAFESWLYDKSPFQALCYEAPLAQLRAALDNDYYERFIETRILNNPHKLILTVRPQQGLNDQKDAQMAEALAAYKESLSAEALQALIAETKALIDRQNTPDSPEVLATLPRLARTDIGEAVAMIPREVHHMDAAEVLYHELFTSRIDYIDVAFDIGHVAYDELPTLSLMAALMGAMDTHQHSYARLDTEEYLHTGGISIAPRVYPDYHDERTMRVKLMASSKSIGVENAAFFFDRLLELLTETDFSDRARFLEVLQMLKSRIEMGVFRQGHTIAASRAASYLSRYHSFNEQLNGLSFLFYLQAIEQDFDARYEELLAQIQALAARLLTRQGLLISVTGDRADFEAMHDTIQAFVARVPATTPAAASQDIALSVRNEGILSSAGVQYVAKAADFTDYGIAYSGDMEVLSNLLSNDYLYNNIRAKGGAYGQGIRFAHSGVMTMYSYRDPNLENTLDVYAGMADYLANLDLDEETLLPYIIGVMNRFDPVMTARTQGRTDLSMRITGQTVEDIRIAKREALATRPETFRRYVDALLQAGQAPALCVLGNSERLQQSRALFDRLVRLEGGNIEQ